MKILIIHQAFVANDQAGGTRHFDFAQFLEKWGHEVMVITSQHSYLTGDSRSSHKGLWIDRWIGNTHIRSIRHYGAYHKSFFHRSLGFLTFSILAFWAALRSPKPDIVFGTTPPIFQDIAAFLTAKWFRVPFVYEVRDLFWDYVVQTGVTNMDFLADIGKWLENILLGKADQLIINSPGFTSHLLSRGARGDKIILIANSVDENQFFPEAAQRQVWEPYGCQDKFIVLYAGAHGMLNNLERLLEAAIALKPYPDIRLCLIGDGKEKASLINKAQEMGLSNLLFVPSQPKAAMPAFVASSDVCVATLRDLPILRTVYPNKVFDYMASGRPIVLAIDGEIRRVVEEASAGIFVPPGDGQAIASAILVLYGDRLKAETMGKNGRNYVTEHFRRVDQATKLQEVLIAVVNKRFSEEVHL